MIVLSFLHLLGIILEISFLLLVTRGGDGTITKYSSLGDLTNRRLFSYSSGEYNSHIKVPAGLVSGEVFLPDVRPVPSCWVLT